MNDSTAIFLGIAVGLLSHWGYFIHGERHRQSAAILITVLLAPPLFYLGATYWLEAPMVTSFRFIGFTMVAFCGSLFISISIYRVFFHRLARFPGPTLAAWSKIYHAYNGSRKANFRFLDHLHKKYGPIVRVGPNELSITDPAAVHEILGPRSQCSKAPFYDIFRPFVSLHSVREKKIHDRRRKVWDQWFSIKTLRNFEKRELVYAHQLARRIENHQSQPINVSMWFNLFSFDVMGDLAFGRSFNALQTGELLDEKKLFAEGQDAFTVLQVLPWASPIVRLIPGAFKASSKFEDWCFQQALKRKDAPEGDDLMNLLIRDSYNMGNKKATKLWLGGDALLIIVAGSESVAVTLIHIFFYLSKYPSEVEKLRTALEPLVLVTKDLCNDSIKDVPHLNGVINEALRLHPPLSSGLLRVTPESGITCGEVHIPGNVTVSTPFYTVGRSAQAYIKPDEFIPERWYSQPDLVLDKSAFAPFSLGRYSCIGKNLALMEIRTVTALLVLQYDVSFAAGEDGSSLINESKDAFTLVPEALQLVFRPREGKKVKILPE